MAGNPREQRRYAPIFLESLRGGENRSNHQARAKAAYQRLYRLYEELPSNGLAHRSLVLDGGRELLFTKKTLTRRGYEGAMAITAVMIQRDGKDSSFVAHFSLSEQGATDFSLPESVFIEDKPMEDIFGNEGRSYTQLFAPEASKPLVNWLSRMRREGKYIPPPQFSLPPHTPFSPS